MAMRAVKFLAARTLNDGQIAEVGSVHHLNDASAAHHVKRGAAEYVEFADPTPMVLPEDPQSEDDSQDPPNGDSQEPSGEASSEQESSDGNALEGAEKSVAQPDSGDSGERAEPVGVFASTPSPRRGRGSRRG